MPLNDCQNHIIKFIKNVVMTTNWFSLSVFRRTQVGEDVFADQYIRYRKGFIKHICLELQANVEQRITY